jgi:hypothetical protein
MKFVVGRASVWKNLFVFGDNGYVFNFMFNLSQFVYRVYCLIPKANGLPCGEFFKDVYASHALKHCKSKHLAEYASVVADMKTKRQWCSRLATDQRLIIKFCQKYNRKDLKWVFIYFTFLTLPFLIYRQVQFLNNLAIAASIPHFSISSFLHGNMRRLLQSMDARMYIPNSYSTIRRAMKVVRRSFNSSFKQYISELYFRHMVSVNSRFLGPTSNLVTFISLLLLILLTMKTSCNRRYWQSIW